MFLGQSFRDSAFSLLRDGRFKFFFLAVFASNIGSWLQNVALSWVSLDLRNTPFSFGFISFLGTIPSLVLPFLGGYLADNFEKRKVLLICQSAGLLVALSIGISVYTGVITYPLLSVFALINGIATALAYPVYFTLMTDMIEGSDIPRALSLNSLQFNLSRMIGPVLFSFFVFVAGTGGCFLVNALSFVPFLYFLVKLDLPCGAHTAERRSFISDFSEGMKYLAMNRAILCSIITIGVFSVFVLPYFGMMPYIIKNLLHDDPKTLGYLMGALGSGSISAAFIISFLSREKKKVLLRFYMSAMFFSVSLLILSFTETVTSVAAGSFFFGFMMVFFYASGNSFVQMDTIPEMRGRVVGLFTVVYLGVYPLGLILMGWLSEMMQIRTVLRIHTVISVLLLAGLIALLKRPLSHTN